MEKKREFEKLYALDKNGYQLTVQVRNYGVEASQRKDSKMSSTRTSAGMTRRVVLLCNADVKNIGGLLKKTSSSNLSLFQAIRCMSSSKLFIGALSYNTDDQSLREAFTSFGQVVEARVILDRETGRSRGFGFITFTSREENSAAISGMEGKDLHGRWVRVNYATDRPAWPARGYGGGGRWPEPDATHLSLFYLPWWSTRQIEIVGFSSPKKRGIKLDEKRRARSLEPDLTELPPSALHWRFPSSSSTETILQPAWTTSHHWSSCYLMSKYGRLKLVRSKSSNIQRTSLRNQSRLLQLVRKEKYVGKFMTGCNSTFAMSSKQIRWQEHRHTRTILKGKSWRSNHIRTLLHACNSHWIPTAATTRQNVVKLFYGDG